MTKIKTISILTILIASLVLTAPFIWAEDTSTSTTSSSSTTSTSTTLPINSHPMPLIVEIGPAGNALIRGTVTNVSTDYLTLKTWGGTWTIKIDNNTKFAPQGLTLSQIQTNDFIGLNGKVNGEETLTVNATLIRDWTEKKIIKEETQQNKKEVKQIIKETPKPETRILTIESVNTNNTLTAKLNTQTITVSLANNVKLLDRNWKTITFDQLKANDTIRVYGVLSSTTLEASVIRDISIPRK
jgi:hypothetical protein